MTPIGPSPLTYKQKIMNDEKRPVVVCTIYGGVFFGYAAGGSGDTIRLERAHKARISMYRGSTPGVRELVDTGPPPGYEVGARADIDVHDVTVVFDVSEAARAAWEAAR